MRAIALAIILGTYGIELAVRGQPQIPISGGAGLLVFMFLVCLAFGV